MWKYNSNVHKQMLFFLNRPRASWKQQCYNDWAEVQDAFRLLKISSSKMLMEKRVCSEVMSGCTGTIRSATVWGSKVRICSWDLLLVESGPLISAEQTGCTGRQQHRMAGQRETVGTCHPSLFVSVAAEFQETVWCSFKHRKCEFMTKEYFSCWAE